MHSPSFHSGKNLLNKGLSLAFSFVFVANLLAPGIALADGSSPILNTVTLSAVGASSWTVPAGVSSIDVKVWAGGGAGGSGEKTDNSNLSGLGGGGGGYTEQTITVNPGDTYVATIGAGGQSSGQNGGASSFVGTNADLLTTGGLAGDSNTGTGPGYPTPGGAGGIGNGGNSATNLAGGNGGIEGCDPGNCSGNARASGGGGAGAGGVGGVGLTPGDTSGTSGSSGTTGISGGGAGGAAGWQGRDGSCTSGCGGGGANAGDGVFPGGGGGGSDVGPGGFGANGEIVINNVSAQTKVAQSPVSSQNATITLGQSFTPAENGGSGSGGWQFTIESGCNATGCTNWNPGNGLSGTDTGTNPATDGAADYVPSWTPPAVGTYTFDVAKNGDGTYLTSNFAGPYTLTVTAASNGGGSSTSTPITTSLTTTAGSCVAPGTTIPFTATVAGSGVTSVILQKDTNGDGVYGQDTNTPLQTTSWTAPGTYTFNSNESSTYTGTYSLQLVVNGIVENTVNVVVSGSCGGSNPNPTHVLEVLPQGPGTVTSNPSGISCSSISGCSAIYNTGTSVTLTATPNAGATFSGWGGACTDQGTTSTCALVLSSDMIVRANFAVASSSNSTSTPITTSLTTTAGSCVAPGTTIPFTATVAGSGVTSVILQKDTNGDGVYGQDTNTPLQTTSWTAPGTYTFNSNESSTYTGTYSLQLVVNGIVENTVNVVVSGSCSGTSPSGGGPSSGGGGGGGTSVEAGTGGHPIAPPGGQQQIVPQTVTTTTSVTNAQASAPTVPVVGPSVCKAGDFITAYMRQGINNDPTEVKKLQTFLNEYEGANLDVSGVFDASTTAAVEAFQVKYAKDVLSPWGIDTPTGIVYITTTHEINNIFCSLNPDYSGGPAATTTPQFNGAVGFNATSTTLGFGQNVAGVLGAMSQGLKDFLKDILWYPLLILLLLGTGIWLILRYIFLKDIKDKDDPNKQKIFLDGIGMFSAGSVLNIANTLFYILTPAAFMLRTNMTVGMVLGLDSINIILTLVATLASLYMFQGYVSRRTISVPTA